MRCLLALVKYYGTGSLQHRSQHSDRRCGPDLFHHVFIILFQLISLLAVWHCSKCTYSYGHRSNLSTFFFPPCRKRPPGLYFILAIFGIHTGIVWYNISQSDMPRFLSLRLLCSVSLLDVDCVTGYQSIWLFCSFLFSGTAPALSLCKDESFVCIVPTVWLFLFLGKTLFMCN